MEINKRIVIVMYHYVRDLEYSRYPGIKGLDVRLFEEQLQYIQKHFQVITMEALMAAYGTGDFSGLPERPLLLTFDDGYIDHFTVVFPLLKKYGMQGSFFPSAGAVSEHRLLDVNKIHHILAVAPVDDLVKDCLEKVEECRGQGIQIPSGRELYRELAVPNRWDPGEVIFVKRLLQNRLPEKIRGQIATELFEKYVGIPEETFARELYMNREQIACMKEDGMFFGIHGYDHCWLAKIPTEQMQQDIEKAREYFSGIVDERRWVMNYPYGNYSEQVVEYVREKGCVLGLSVEADYATPGADCYTLPRFDTNDLPPKGKRVV